MARNKDITFDDAMKVVNELAREIKVSTDISIYYTIITIMNTYTSIIDMA